MLIDWVTVRVPLDLCSAEVRAAAALLGDRIQRYCPVSGELRYETQAWDSIRSDSHQIQTRATVDLWIQGSPARIMGNGCAVFGSGPSAALDLKACVQRMIAFVQSYMGAGDLPSWEHWLVTRVDVTGNLRLESLAEVREALAVLRNCEGGRYRVSQQAGDTVYWSNRSKMRSGKAYAKGPHLAHVMKKPDYTGYSYSPAEIAAASKLLRLELSLKREWFSRNEWASLTPSDLAKEWHDYFDRMIGGAEVSNENELKKRIEQAAPTDGQAKAAYGCWCMIQSQGWERSREFFTKTTWYRNMKILRDAGLGDADLSAGQVVQLRRRVIEAQMVTDWAQIAA